MKTRIVALGNPILSDEAAGLRAAQALAQTIEKTHPEVDFVESEIGGLVFMELMDGWDRVIILDALQKEGTAPGTVLRLSLTDDLPSVRLRYVHEADLPTAVALGRKLGHSMPEQIHIFGIQASDVWTFSDKLTPAVEAAIPQLVQEVVAVLNEN